MNPVAEMTDDRCVDDLDRLSELLERIGAKRLLLVTDPIAYRASGAQQRLAPLWLRYPAASFSGFEPNPKLDHLVDAIVALGNRPGGAVDPPDSAAVVAIGGGTAIDLAKLVAWVMPHIGSLGEGALGKDALADGGSKRDLLTARLREMVLGGVRDDSPVAHLPMIAVPTTAGTGSEATQFAVVYVDGVKRSVDSPRLMPQGCVLDPALTAGLPPMVTAHTGLDALCQGIESAWAVKADARSLEDAEGAVRIAWGSLEEAVKSPSAGSRRGMIRAAHLAGRAIQRTRTTAAHAISYTFTSEFGIPHGHAVALTLGPLLNYNALVTDGDCCDPRGAEAVRRRIDRIVDWLGCRDAQEARVRFEGLLDRLGCERRLSVLGISGGAALERIASRVDPQRLGNNPRRLSHEAVVGLLESVA